MRIVFLLTRGTMYRYTGGTFGKFLRYAPLTLPTLLALIPEDIHASVAIYDEGIERIDVERIQADLVCLSSVTGGAMRAYAYAQYFKSKGIPVAMGGVHATLMPEEAAKYVDAVATGSGIETFPQLLRDFQAGKLQKRYDGGKIASYAGFPLPHRQCYADKKHRFVTVNSVQATYGCRNNCEFCVTPYSSRGYHHRPIEEVVDEIRQIKQNFFVFVDPSPIEDEYAKELYRALIPLKKRWASPMTIRIGHDKELLEVAVRSGMKGALIGFESVSKETLRGIRKGFNAPDTYFAAVRRLHDKGVAIMGCFVFGLDHDDAGCFQRTVDFVNAAAIDLPRFTVNTAYPGTDYYNRLKAQGRILEDDWSLFDCQHVVVKPLQMSVEELREGHQMAWTQAYSLPSIIRRLSVSRCFLPTVFAANMAYKVYARNLHSYTIERMCDCSDIPQPREKTVCV